MKPLLYNNLPNIKEDRCRAGYNLIEVMIALGVVAVALPLAMALIVATSDTTRMSEEETRGTFMARNVFEEIRHARDGQGKYITRKLSWPNFPGSDSWLVLYADADGQILGEAGSGAYKEGIKKQNAAYLIAIRGEEYEGLDDILEDSSNQNSGDHSEIQISLVELRIETPAIATEEGRNSQRKPLKFVQLMPQSD